MMIVLKLLGLDFFVDNLATTSNSLEKLCSLYKTCAERMEKAHFNLRSCNSNNDKLRQLMIKDGSIVSHDSPYEKVLG